MPLQIFHAPQPREQVTMAKFSREITQIIQET